MLLCMLSLVTEQEEEEEAKGLSNFLFLRQKPDPLCIRMMKKNRIHKIYT